jgi:N-acetylglucosamine malate deacetylase 1
MKVLLLLAHADDETLGVGGTAQQLLAQGHAVHAMIASEGVVDLRPQAADNRPALAHACAHLGLADWQCLDLPDQRFETIPVAEIASQVGRQLPFAPDVIITHSARDLNCDHRIIAEVGHILGRPRGRAVSILACEIPCVSLWHGTPFAPTCYVGLTEAQLARKIEAFGFYLAEHRAFPDPYSSQGLETLARQRGMEAGYAAAEAFEVIRWYPQHGWKVG